MPLFSNVFGQTKKAVAQLGAVVLVMALLVLVPTPPAARATNHSCVDWTDYSVQLGVGPKVAGSVETLTDVEGSGVDVRITWVTAARTGPIVDTSTGGDFTEVLDYVTLLGSNASTPSVFRYWVDQVAGGNLTFEFLDTGTTNPVDVTINSVLTGGQRRIGGTWAVSEIALTSGGAPVVSTYANPDLSGSDVTATDGLTGLGTTPIIELNHIEYGVGNVSAYNQTRDSYVVVGPDQGQVRDWTVLDWGGVPADTLNWKLYGQTSASQPDPETANLPHVDHGGLSAYISGLCFTQPGAAGPTIAIEKATNAVDSDSAPGETLVAGQRVTWNFEVTVTGTVDTLTVTDSLVADGDIDCEGTGSNTLGVTSDTVISCVATGTAITGAYMNTGFADATVGGTDLPPVSDPSHYTGATPSIWLEKDTNGVQADSDTLNDGTESPSSVATGATNLLAAGDAITWTFVVTNNGGVPLVNVAAPIDTVDVANDQAGATAISCNWGTSTNAATPANVLEIDEVVICTATGTAGTGLHENTANVTGDAALVDAGGASWSAVLDGNGDPIPVVDADDSGYTGAAVIPSIDIEKDTNGVQADGASDTGPVVALGDAVTWTFVVTNDGNVDLADVVVGDAVTADNGTTAGTIVCDWAASSDAATPDRNLSVGETVSCTATSIAVAGQYRNNSNVKGTPVADATTADPDNPTPLTGPSGADLADVTDEDPSAYLGAAPSIDIEKTTNTIQADTGPGPNIGVGSDVLWSFVVTNNGSVDLAGVIVADTVTTDNGTDVGAITCDWAASSDPATPAGNLSTAETVPCTATGTAKVGQFKNNAAVSGTPVADAASADPENPVALTDGSGVALPDPTDEDPSAYFGALFDLALRKQLSDGSNAALVSIGDEVTFVITVLNQGDTNGSNIEVVDYVPEGLKLNDPDWTEANGIATTALTGVVLEPGESTTVEIAFTVLPGASAITNIAEISTATPTAANGETIMEIRTTGTPAVLPDVDSVADSTDGESPVDDVIDNSGGDEDDHDVAVLSIRDVPTPVVPLPVTGNEVKLPITVALVLGGLGSLLVASSRRGRRSEN